MNANQIIIELDRINNLNISTWAEYAKLRRVGADFAMGRLARKRVWALASALRNADTIALASALRALGMTAAGVVEAIKASFIATGVSEEVASEVAISATILADEALLDELAAHLAPKVWAALRAA